MSFDIRARISADATGFDAAMRNVETRAGGMAENIMSSVGGKLAGLFSIAALEEGFRNVIEYGSKIQDLATRTGIATDDLQKFDYAAKVTGTSLESMVTGVEKLSIAMAKSRAGDATQLKALGTLGLNAQQIKELAPAEAFRTIGDHIQRLPEITGEALEAMKTTMGRGAMELVGPMREGIRRLGDDIEKSGGIIPPETIAQLDAFDDAMVKGGVFIKSTFGAAFMVINELITAFITNIAAAASAVGAFISAYITAFKSGNLADIAKAPITAVKAAMTSFQDIVKSQEMEADRKKKENEERIKAGKKVVDPDATIVTTPEKRAAQQEKERKEHEAISEAARIKRVREETAEVRRKESLEGLSANQKEKVLVGELAAMRKELAIDMKDPWIAEEDIERGKLAIAKRESELKKLQARPEDRMITDSLARIGGFSGTGASKLESLSERIALASEKTAENTSPSNSEDYTYS